MIDLNIAFDKAEGEYLKFDRVENKLSQRPDLHAFMLLDKLVPGSGDMISASGHDEYYLSIDCNALAAVATEAQIVDLNRCGVMYSPTEECLSLFA